MGKLDGKVAIVTGASKGIGSGIALALAAEGAAVAVNYTSNRNDADAVVQKIAEVGGKGVPIQGNVSSAADIDRIFAEAEEKLGPIDILVNNAGVFKPAPLDQFDESEFHRHFNTNVLGVFLSSKKAAQVFGDRGGNIINIGSAGVSSTPPTYSLYVSTKAAVNSLTQVLAKELGNKNIRVNCINPGFTETDGAKAGGSFDQMAAATAARTPLGRIGQPEDIGLVAAFLASDESRWLTGEIIYASGGFR